MKKNKYLILDNCEQCLIEVDENFNYTAWESCRDDAIVFEEEEARKFLSELRQRKYDCRLLCLNANI